MTLVDKAMAALKAAGLDAKKPANHMGECKTPYLVVQDGGEPKPGGRSTCKRAVIVHAFVPDNQPNKLPTLLADARMAMHKVSALRLTATSEEDINDGFKAITASLTYTALCAR